MSTEGSQTSLYFLLYVSYATQKFSLEELESLWKMSARKNVSLGLTGMLLYMNNRFIQVIEGEKSRVQQLYERISSDKRHRDTMVILEGILEEKNFKNWSMGFYHLDDKSDHKFLLAGEHILDHLGSEIHTDEHPALSFLKMFRDKQGIKNKSSEVV